MLGKNVSYSLHINNIRRSQRPLKQGFNYKFVICLQKTCAVNLSANHSTRTEILILSGSLVTLVSLGEISFLYHFTKCIQKTRLPVCWIKAVNLNCQSRKMLDQATMYLYDIFLLQALRCNCSYRALNQTVEGSGDRNAQASCRIVGTGKILAINLGGLVSAKVRCISFSGALSTWPWFCNFRAYFNQLASMQQLFGHHDHVCELICQAA